MEKQGKTERIMIKVTAGEKKAIYEKATAAEMSLSEFMRKELLSVDADKYAKVYACAREISDLLDYTKKRNYVEEMEK